MRYILLIVVFVTGCQQAIYELDGTKKRIKVNTLFMHLDFHRLKWNELEIEEYDADAQDVDVLTPYGGIGAK
jgi:hypothetical protein